MQGTAIVWRTIPVASGKLGPSLALAVAHLGLDEGLPGLSKAQGRSVGTPRCPPTRQARSLASVSKADYRTTRLRWTRCTTDSGIRSVTYRIREAQVSATPMKPMRFILERLTFDSHAPAFSFARMSACKCATLAIHTTS